MHSRCDGLGHVHQSEESAGESTQRVSREEGCLTSVRAKGSIGKAGALISSARRSMLDMKSNGIEWYLVNSV